QGVLRGWSIGFVPLRARRLEDGEGGAAGRRGLRVEEWDLLEYSAVPVPENPAALTLAVRKGLVRHGPLRGLLQRLSSLSSVTSQPEPPPRGDVLEELLRRQEEHFSPPCGAD